MHNFQVNASLQVLPIIQNKHPYKWIDETIEIIKKSGLKYEVGAFSTAIEGKYDDILNVVNSINEYLYIKRCHEWIMTVQFQIRANDNITIAEKTENA
jgi:uncharacterized protein (TIGR00106 family)